ncbi:hypothetical protein AOXY_G5477 [Acipenser oxyrinchus oxyrinchus]|uniref:Uncharacterized protein n=1 Tax=Acipenser oxyrinchus oxyrinchus TaxID=40147 RepID=A0AAD8LR81_ACIOX|nr:hypothetical protein AOXY_G5477 [Acipenser oxyrinchus oxyrinchus]
MTGKQPGPGVYSKWGCLHAPGLAESSSLRSSNTVVRLAVFTVVNRYISGTQCCLHLPKPDSTVTMLLYSDVSNMEDKM